MQGVRCKVLLFLCDVPRFIVQCKSGEVHRSVQVWRKDAIIVVVAYANASHRSEQSIEMQLLLLLQMRGPRFFHRANSKVGDHVLRQSWRTAGSLEILDSTGSN